MKPFPLIVLLLVASEARSQVPIRDNSFLVEEAFNQEEGVIQHIFFFQFDRSFKNADASFTEEWPAGSPIHQVSVTIPYRFYDGTHVALNDLLINYRYQLVATDHVFISPRISCILPTGHSDQSANAGGTGIQLNGPLSIEMNRKLTLHFNIGNTWLWYNHESDEQGLKKSTTYSGGLSLIYNLSQSINLMLETVHSSTRNMFNSGADETEKNTVLNPGFRFAINFPSGLQIVPGISVPFDLKSKENFYLFYLSFEHPLKKTKS